MKQRKALRGGRVLIRRCTARDIAGVLALWKRADAAPSVTDDAAALRRRLRRDGDLFLVACDGPRIVATIMGGWDGWRASMARLAVDPAYRRRGIAKDLASRVEKRLRARGAKRISGIVLKANRRARGFWQDAGYEPHPQVVRYVKDL